MFLSRIWRVLPGFWLWKGYAPICLGLEDFYVRRLYLRIQVLSTCLSVSVYYVLVSEIRIRINFLFGFWWSIVTHILTLWVMLLLQGFCFYFHFGLDISISLKCKCLVRTRFWRSPSMENARMFHCKPVKNKSRVYMKCKLVTRLIVHDSLSPSIGVDIRKKNDFVIGVEYECF